MGDAPMEKVNNLRGLLRNVWLQIAVLTLLIVFVYARTLAGIYTKALTNDDYSHVFLIPFIIGYLIWERRKNIKNAEIMPSWIGFSLMIFTLLFSIYGILGSDISAARISWWLWLVSIVLFCYGMDFLKILFLPIVMLSFTIPLPQHVQAPLTMSLKLISSKLAAFIIGIANMPVYVDGNIIDLGQTQLQVVDACSGLRYVLPLMTLGILCAYFFQRQLWKRAVLFLLTLPIAVLMNGLRISGTAILYQWASPKVAEGFFHRFSGWLVFVISFALLIGFSYILKAIPPNDIKKQNISNPDSNPGNLVHKRQGRSNILPFTIAAALLSGLLLASLSTGAMPRIKLADGIGAFPLEFRGWKGISQQVDPEIVKKSGAEESFQATYTNNKNGFVSLYIGYRGTPFMEGEEFFHSPTVCLPAGGWNVLEQDTYAIPGASTYYNEFVVRKMIVEKMGEKQILYFWFQTNRKIANIIFQNRFHLAMSALRRANTYDLTVHTYTPIRDRGDLTTAQERLDNFVRDLEPVMTEFLGKTKSKV
jgi:exosortase D (VPLPA-CTERM-specific)